MSWLINKYYRTRSQYWRLHRLIFPSPAELKFIELMGGRVVMLPLWSRKTNFNMAIVLSRGKILRGERFKRERRIGRYFADFANDIGRTIEIDGKDYHRNIVHEFDRDSYIYSHGFRTLHIPAGELYRNPDRTIRNVLKFLYE